MIQDDELSEHFNLEEINIDHLHDSGNHSAKESNNNPSSSNQSYYSTNAASISPIIHTSIHENGSENDKLREKETIDPLHASKSISFSSTINVKKSNSPTLSSKSITSTTDFANVNNNSQSSSIGIPVSNSASVASAVAAMSPDIMDEVMNQGEDFEFREQDRYLPIANISRIMKKCLPSNAKIAKDARETVQECVSEFIAFITSEASDWCIQEKRKTINGEDLLGAMHRLGFDHYCERLRDYLAKYREGLKVDKSTKRKRETNDNRSSTSREEEDISPQKRNI